jgi:fructokinase
MKSVLCFGEALIDFLNTSKQNDGPLTLNNYRQYPGGAPANAAVAVAKLGGKALFAGQVGDDPFGHFLSDALTTYHVDTRFLAKHPTAKTAIAFVLLDESGDRSFSFHRHQTADVLFSIDQISEQWFVDEPIFHFCSNTLTEDTIANTTLAAVDKARDNNSLVSFDVNLRHNLWLEGKADIQLINHLVVKADLIKFSRDEIDYLAQGNMNSYIQQCFKSGVSLIIITDGEHDIEYYTAHGGNKISAPTVVAEDTTAGGDAFSGSLLYALSHFSQPKTILHSHETLDVLIKFSSHCGAHTVTKPGAFPALPSFDDVKEYWPANLPTQT